MVFSLLVWEQDALGVQRKAVKHFLEYTELVGRGRVLQELLISAQVVRRKKKLVRNEWHSWADTLLLNSSDQCLYLSQEYRSMLNSKQ